MYNHIFYEITVVFVTCFESQAAHALLLSPCPVALMFYSAHELTGPTAPDIGSRVG